MKKILILLLTTASFAAQGQWLVGANASFNRFGNERNQRNSINYFYTLTPTLDVGYRIGAHLSTGVSASVNYATSTTKYRISNAVPALYDQYKETEKDAMQYLSWRAGIWLRYDLPLTEHLLLFAHLNLAGGSDHQRRVVDESFYNSQTQQMETRHRETTQYGNASHQVLGFNADITPGVAYRFDSHWTAELWLDILKIAYMQNWNKASRSTVQTLNSLIFGQQPLYGMYFFEDSPTSGMMTPSIRLGLTYNF
ncbi:MAG: hypothetical protein IJ785_08650 [Bacteroidales bacterium]|nr:hypothetical protein [Bacteroidales bacterium]